MNSNSKNLNIVMSFWSILGPILIVFTLCIALIHSPSIPWTVLCVALVGLVLSSNWKWRGVLTSLAILSGVFSYLLYTSSSNEWIWNLVLCFCFATAFVVTALSSEEVQTTWNAINQENQDNQKNILGVSERLQACQNKFQIERQELVSRIDESEKEHGKLTDRLSAVDRLNELAKSEIKAMQEHQDHLLQELFDARREIASLELQLDGKLSVLVKPSEEESQTKILSELVDQKERELSDLYQCLKKQENDLQLLKEELNAKNEKLNANDIHCAMLYQSAQQEKKSATKFQQDILHQQSLVQELSNRAETLSREKFLLETTVSRLQDEVENFKVVLERHEEDLLTEQAKTDLQKKSHEIVQKQLKLQLEDAQNKSTLASEQLIDVHQKIHHLSLLEKEHQTLTDQYAQISARCTQLTVEKDQLIEQLQQAQKAVDQQAAIETPNSTVIEESRETRRVLGLYHQLREQFAQKSAVLDATRRELFHSQEKLLAMDKEMTEIMQFDESEHERHLWKILTKIDDEHSQVEKLQQREIEDLNDIIQILSGTP